MTPLIESFKLVPSGEKEWQLNDMKDVFQHCISEVLKHYDLKVFLDALNECGRPAALDLMEFFHGLDSSTAGHFALCFSCTPYPNLHSDIENFPKIIMEKTNSVDIQQYIDTKLEPWSTLQCTIGPKLRERAQGIFQWVFLVLKIVIERALDGDRPEVIEHAVEETPQELSDLYSQLFSEIAATDSRKREEAFNLFAWVCFAFHPIKLQGMKHAILIKPENPSGLKSKIDLIKKHPMTGMAFERRIRHLSRGLVEIKIYPNYNNDDHGIRQKADVNHHLQFIHQSVKSFLLDTKFRTLREEPIDNLNRFMNTRLARCCAQYMYLIVSEMKSTPSILPDRLFEYAQIYCWDHASLGKQAEMDQAYLLDDIHWPSNSELVLKHCKEPFSSRSLGKNMFHIIASHGLTSVLLVMLKTGSTSEEIGAGDILGATPLHLAASKGYLDIIKILIRQAGVDINALDSKHRSPLRYAIDEDEKSVIEYLIQAEVEVNLPDVKHMTPLEATWVNERLDIMHLLLRHPKIEPNVISHFGAGNTLLHKAVVTRNEDVMKVLLQDDRIDPNKWNKEGITPLHLAVIRNEARTWDFLLARADLRPNRRDKEGDTPLHFAVKRGKESSVRQLLGDMRVDIDALNKDFRTALEIAELRGNRRIINRIKAAQEKRRNQHCVDRN
ncbi:MAG: hypothetical protein Q9167_006698 [Letrouitia subvulpina]